jgi:uncharacterized protein
LLSRERVRDEQNEPFAILNIGYDGKVSTFSQELLGAHIPRYGNAVLGHITSDRLSDIEYSSLFQAMNSEIQRGVGACKRECAYFKWCGGGAPANKIFETSRFDTTETMHCRLTQQLLLDEVISKLDAETQKSPITLKIRKTHPLACFIRRRDMSCKPVNILLLSLLSAPSL